MSVAGPCPQGAVKAEAQADLAMAGRGRQCSALRPAPSRLRTGPAGTARAPRAPAQSNRRSSPSLEAPCACAPPPCCPPPTLPHPPGRSPDDVEGIPGLLSGPRPGGAPGDLRHRCQPGLRGRAEKDADPQSGAEVRGGEG